MRIFTNGTLFTSHANATSFANGILTINKRYTGTASTWLGTHDGIRITKGVARYTANFTAPTSEFPTS